MTLAFGKHVTMRTAHHLSVSDHVDKKLKLRLSSEALDADCIAARCLDSRLTVHG